MFKTQKILIVLFTTNLGLSNSVNTHNLLFLLIEGKRSSLIIQEEELKVLN